MSQKSTVQMSFVQQPQQQVQHTTTTTTTTTKGGYQQITTQQQQKQQPQQQVQQVHQQKPKAPQQMQNSIPAQQKAYASGAFGHIKDNLDAYHRLDAATANMSLRAPRAGDQFDNERKLEKRYDEEEKLGTPHRVIDWINRALHGQVQGPTGLEWKHIQLYLRDGVILCKLLNKCLRHASMKPVGYKAKINSGFASLTNLETFAAGCKRYGVPTSSLFQPSDLYEGRKGQLTNVLHCLNALGCVANARGFQPAYEEPAPPKADWCKDECYD